MRNNSFLKYVSLSVISMVGVSAYFLADTFFIANGIGVLGLAALNIALPVFGIVNGLGLMIGMGTATKYKLYKSQGLHQAANRVTTVGLIMELVFAAVILTVGVFATRPICTLFGANAEILDMTVDYMRTILIASPFFLVNHFLICVIRNDGMPSISMTAMMLSNLTNIILDYVFVFPLKMGMFGAALATAISPIVSSAFVILSVVFRRNHFGFAAPQGGLSLPFSIAKLGFPSLIAELSSGIVVLLFNILILPISGNVGVAAYGVIANISMVCFAIFTGIAQGIQPIVSHAVAGQNNKMIQKTYLKAILLALVLSALMYMFLLLMDDWVISVFNRENNVDLIPIAKEGILLYFTALFFSGINYVTIALFSSVDKPKQAFILSFTRGIVAITPSVFLMCYLFKMKGIWLSLMVAEFITVLLSFATVFFYFRNIKRSTCIAPPLPAAKHIHDDIASSI